MELIQLNFSWRANFKNDFTENPLGIYLRINSTVETPKKNRLQFLSNPIRQKPYQHNKFSHFSALADVKNEQNMHNLKCEESWKAC